MTTQSAKTPTPWQYAPTGDTMKAYQQPFAIAQEGARNLIAGCFGDVKGGEKVAEANAAHIVHCVNHFDEMREALELAKRTAIHLPNSEWYLKAIAILEKVKS